MKKAYAYIRVSTNRQAEEDKFGLEDQLESIKSWAKSNGYEIEKVFKDSHTGTDQNRPGLQDLLSQVRKESHPVIVAKIDRWARDTLLHLFLEKEIVKHGSELLSVAESSTNGDTPETDLMRTMMMAFAKFEAQRISARMSGGRRRKAEGGGHATGRVPYGYQKNEETGRLEPHPEEAEVVARMFDMREDGDSLRTIAGALNDEGVKTRKGNKWRAKSVSYILKNDKYKGKLVQMVDGEMVTTKNKTLDIHAYGKSKK